jgi:hypothetical protein
MATISSDILASYAADAAREVNGVRGLVESAIRKAGWNPLQARDGVEALELVTRAASAA